MKIKTFDDFLQYASQHNIETAIVRCDLNIPSDIQDYSRIEAIKDTVLAASKLVKRIVLISHYKRPTAGLREDKYSLSRVLEPIKTTINKDVTFVPQDIYDINSLPDAEIILLENLRFYEGETKKDIHFAEQIAKFGDVYINDGFSVSHRAHASVEAITRLLPSFAGISLTNTIQELEKIIQKIERPYTAIIGGSKVSTKIDALRQLSKISDNLVIGGAMANVFLAAQGKNMQKSMVEKDLIEEAKKIIQESKSNIVLPIDFMCSDSITKEGVLYDEVPESQACFDIGEKSVSKICSILQESKTIMWNGAIGAFEFANFNGSSVAVSTKISELSSVTRVIGGGETVASIPSHLKDRVGFICTAGGAFLEYIAGYKLPGIEALAQGL